MPIDEVIYKTIDLFDCRETWVQDDINWIDDETLEYVPKKIFRFVPRLSNGRQTDLVTTINIPLIVSEKKLKIGFLS